METLRDRSIGIFDSGVGGLTVLKEMLRDPSQRKIHLLRRHSAPPLWRQKPRNHHKLLHREFHLPAEEGDQTFSCRVQYSLGTCSSGAYASFPSSYYRHHRPRCRQRRKSIEKWSHRDFRHSRYHRFEIVRRGNPQTTSFSHGCAYRVSITRSSH